MHVSVENLFLVKNQKEKRRIEDLTKILDLGPRNFPFFGCALQVAYMSRKYKSFEVFEKFCKDYGPVVGLQIGLQYTGKF